MINTTGHELASAIRRFSATARHVAEPGSHKDDQRVVLAGDEAGTAHLYLCWASTQEHEDPAGEIPSLWTVEMWLETWTSHGDDFRWGYPTGLADGCLSFGGAWLLATEQLAQSAQRWVKDATLKLELAARVGLVTT